MEDCFAVPDFRAKIEFLKYCRWATKIDDRRLEALIWAVGEFGPRFSETRRAVGFYAGPDIHVPGMDVWRMRGALETIAQIVADERREWLGGLVERFSGERNAFSAEFRSRLVREVPTAWAEARDERDIAALLWMVGEYAGRVLHCDTHGRIYAPWINICRDEDRRVMRAALRMITLVHWGQVSDVEEVKRFIEDDPFQYPWEVGVARHRPPGSLGACES